MKVSGFTICRNAVKYDYPIVEVICSALPIVDEFIINVGQSEDGTLELLRSIDSDKIRIIESYWDDSMKQDGLLFSHQTNIALSHCQGGWALYLQADEILHEDDYGKLQKAFRDNVENTAVLGFTFRYVHFYGDYWSCNPWFYHRAVRVIRNDGQVESCGDAVGFWLKSDRRYLQTAHKDRVLPSGGTIYHYGWVKSPKVLLDKFRYQIARHHGDHPGAEQKQMLSCESYDFKEYHIMKNFTGPHPSVMVERIRDYPVLNPKRNRWLEPAFYRAILQRGFRG